MNTSNGIFLAVVLLSSLLVTACDVDKATYMVGTLERDRIDALALTGHKSLLGPPGSGALCVSTVEGMEPLLHGGTGSRRQLDAVAGAHGPACQFGNLGRLLAACGE